MSELDDGRGRGEAVPVDGAAALCDVAECLRHLACGYGLDPRERAAAIAILEVRVPGVPDAEFAAARIILAATRLTARQRQQASALSIRLREMAESLAKIER